MESTIYIIVNLVNDKAYVGVTYNLDKRLGEHSRGRTDNKETALYRAIRKYGWTNFAVAVLDRCDDYNHAVKVLEPYYIEKYKTHVRKNGYNLTNGGEGSLGFNHSDETREFLSKLKTGKKRSEDTKKKIAAASSARRHNAETREKIRKARTGKKRAPFNAEWRANLSKAGIGRKLSQKAIDLLIERNKANPPMRGRKHSPESIAKMSAVQKGRTFSDETIKKMSAAAKNRKRRPHSPETKEKMRQAALRRYQPNIGILKPTDEAAMDVT